MVVVGRRTRGAPRGPGVAASCAAVVVGKLTILAFLGPGGALVVVRLCFLLCLSLSPLRWKIRRRIRGWSDGSFSSTWYETNS
jgi:hypothetical protein